VTPLAACATLAGLLAATAPSPEEFAYRARIEAAPGLAVLTLDEAACRAAASADLRDLRFFNAAGEALPAALLPPPPVAPGPEHELRMIALPAQIAARDKMLAEFALRVETQGARSVIELTPTAPRDEHAETIGGHLLDLRAYDKPGGELRLRFAEDAPDFSGRVEILGSDDLHAWRPLAAGALVRNRQLGETFERSTFVLARPAPFVRIAWTGQAPRLAGARLIERGNPPALPRAILAVARAEAADSWYVDVPVGLPVVRVHVRVAAENVALRVRVYRYDERDPRAHLRPPHLPLRARRAPERWVAEGGMHEVFRLQRNGQWIEGAPFALSARTTRLRIDAVDGTIPGDDLPIVEAEWTPRRYVFAARGPGPYMLALGNDASDLPPGPVLDTRSVMPRDDPAGVSLPAARLAATPIAGADTSRAQRIAREAIWSRYVLWAVLVVAVVALALLAWRLAAQMRPGTDRNGSGGPG